MNAIIGNKVPKVQSYVQRTSYKTSEKLTIIHEAKKIEKLKNANSSNKHVGAKRASFYLEAKEELVKWLNEFCLARIAVTADFIKVQMFNILLTICATKYPNATKQFHASKS
ncbi:8532_t:CDS:2 [Cetraspora pellucida]|uniref:8532_t:CDS:1 n=1 Tax=Cetraspora pellucida TaxID=1433469 RepID=A0A9N8Z5Y9_9GLOM|nr:8532_t:CDS:2 [Cetraspora pellucida]